MIKIGEHNVLRAARRTPPGMFLEDEEGNEVLLPNKYIPETLEEEDTIEVFVYKDSEDRVIATTLEPNIRLHEFACLRVKEVNDIGAFLDWGLEKDLLVPYREQKRKMKEGDTYLVYLYLDEATGRLAASAKIERFLQEEPTVKIGDKVELLIGESTNLGVKVIVNNLHLGLLYHNEIFRKVAPGDYTTGYVKDIRENNKIDISLQVQGFRNIEPSAQAVLDKLKASKGFLNLNDASEPEDIMWRLQMSKKSFKKAIGHLFKLRMIRIEEDGIYLLEEE